MIKRLVRLLWVACGVSATAFTVFFLISIGAYGLVIFRIISSTPLTTIGSQGMVVSLLAFVFFSINFCLLTEPYTRRREENEF